MTSPQQPIRVLVCDDEPAARSALSEMLRDEGYEVQSAADGYKALGKTDAWEPDLLITDVHMPALGGIELMTKLREKFPDVAVVVMTGFGSVEGAVEAMHLGADDYLSKPIHFPQLLMVLRRVIQHRALQRETQQLRDALRERTADESNELIGQSRSFRELLDLVRQIADAPASVLILGETGTGKRTLAELVHRWSPRKDAAFHTLRCSAGDEKTLERELFGEESGGAVTYVGVIEKSQGGTLYLPDIAALPLPLQARLLQFVQERHYKRVGGNEYVQANVRVVSASDQELSQAVANGTFREDLSYRLNVVTLRTPSLRERREDIALLATKFLRKFARQSGKAIVGFGERTLGILLDFDWPGNIRQLEQAIERAVVMARSAEIAPRDLPRELLTRARDNGSVPVIPGSSLREIERYAILRTLEHVGGSTSKAAKILGISPRKIQYRLNEYRITPQSGLPSVTRPQSAG